jgi:hypothetical protein
MKCPKCPVCNSVRLTTIQATQVAGNLMRHMGCLACLHSWVTDLGKSEVIFVDFKKKIVLEKKAS